MFAISIPSLEIYQQLVHHLTGAESRLYTKQEAETRIHIPASDLGTDFGVGAPRDELDFVRHLIQHCQREERKRAGRRIFGGEEINNRERLGLESEVAGM